MSLSTVLAFARSNRRDSYGKRESADQMDRESENANRRQLQVHDRRVKRWRHLDLGASRCWIECELRRLRCPSCGVRLEPVPWARPGAAHTRDFEDVVAWLAQQMAFAPITRLLRVGWHTIGPIGGRQLLRPAARVVHGGERLQVGDGIRAAPAGSAGLRPRCSTSPA